MLTIKVPPGMRRENEAVVAPLPWRDGARRLLLAGAALAVAGGGLALVLAVAYRDGRAPAALPALPLAAACVAAGLWLCRTLARVRTPVHFRVHHGSLDVTGPGTLGLFGPRLRRIPAESVSGVSVAGGRLLVHRRRRPATRVARSRDPQELERVAAVLRSALKLDLDPLRRRGGRTTATVV